MINLLFPGLNTLDNLLFAWLPGIVRVSLWGALCGAAAMGIYRLLSNQGAIAALKQETRALRKRMLDPQLENAEFATLTKRNLLVSLRFLARSGLPSMAASIPVLLVVVWLSAYYAYTVPAGGEPVRIDVLPADRDYTVEPPGVLLERDGSRWLRVDPRAGGVIRFADAAGVAYEMHPQAPPAEYVYKRRWWNLLLGNEAGYIRTEAGVDEIALAYPRRTFVDGVPGWLATWEFPFFVSLFVVALGLKFGFRIE